jgi:hypothetical protein
LGVAQRLKEDPVSAWPRRAANLLLRDHGYDAAIIAAQQRDKLLADGDLDGLRVWKRIMHAIEQLSRGRNDGERE